MARLVFSWGEVENHPIPAEANIKFDSFGITANGVDITSQHEPGERFLMNPDAIASLFSYLCTRLDRLGDSDEPMKAIVYRYLSACCWFVPDHRIEVGWGIGGKPGYGLRAIAPDASSYIIDAGLTEDSCLAIGLQIGRDIRFWGMKACYRPFHPEYWAGTRTDYKLECDRAKPPTIFPVVPQ